MDGSGIPTVLRLGEDVLRSAQVTAVSMLLSVADRAAPNENGVRFPSSESGGAPMTILRAAMHGFRNGEVRWVKNCEGEVVDKVN